MLVTFEALVGFALVTASVSWVLLIYPALARTVTFARRVSVLVYAEQVSGVDLVSNEAEYLLGELMLEVIRARVDLVHFPIILITSIPMTVVLHFRTPYLILCDSPNRAHAPSATGKSGSPPPRFEPLSTKWLNCCGPVTSESKAMILALFLKRSPKINAPVM